MARKQDSGGFTLVELLVVVSIVGILVAIALPSFAGRQGKAYDARVQSDLRRAAAGQEAYFTDHFTYSSDCNDLPGFETSDGVVITDCAGDANGFTLTTDHPRATRSCTWSSGGSPSMTCAPKS
ncbi:MAG: prepilin-type N-terminal cleavage/methylation domain-containing protein [bacterium]|nr:prepilin-type N-terminal cleavage/methylation domain-containing protein [bacterium]